MKEEPKRHEHVFPNIEDWPIYKLSEDRRNFVQEMDEFTLERFMRKPSSQLTDIISKTIYLERIRMKEEPWKVDPPNERQFWRRVQNKLVGQSLDRSKEEARKTNEEILRQIIHRYSEEIAGTFRISTFLFARRFLTLFFTRLLNTAASRNWQRILGSKHRLADRLPSEPRLRPARRRDFRGARPYR